MLEPGPLGLSADWLPIAVADVPARLSPQSILDLEARAALPPGVAAVRTQEGEVSRFVGPIVNSSETSAPGLDARARFGWRTAWADLELNGRWLRRSRHETRVERVNRSRVTRTCAGLGKRSWSRHSMTSDDGSQPTNIPAKAPRR